MHIYGDIVVVCTIINICVNNNRAEMIEKYRLMSGVYMYG